MYALRNLLLLPHNHHSQDISVSKLNCPQLIWNSPVINLSQSGSYIRTYLKSTIQHSNSNVMPSSLTLPCHYTPFQHLEHMHAYPLMWAQRAFTVNWVASSKSKGTLRNLKLAVQMCTFSFFNLFPC